MVSGFLSPLWIEDIDGDTFIVCAPFRYASALLGGELVVPVGTETDFASIPRVLRGLMPKSGRWNKAAVLHDAGYHGCLETPEGARIHLIKALCDRLFLEAMAVAGVGRLTRQFMYRMVQAFGIAKTRQPTEAV